MVLAQEIEKKLRQAFNPTKLVVINQSEDHNGHAGSPNTGNSHFLIEIEAKAFEGKSRVDGQRMVYTVLATEMKQAIHALVLKVSAPVS